jgi:hypothetical protein
MRARWAMAMVVATGVIAGCGGGDDDGGGLSQAELEKQTAAICKEGQSKLQAIPEPADITDPGQAAKYLGAVLTAADGQITKLKALEPADDIKANYDAYLAEVQESRDILGGIRDKANAQDPSGMQDLERYLSGEREKATKAAATKAGLKTCAST